MNPELEPGARMVEQYSGGPGFTVSYTREVWEGDDRKRDETFTWQYSAQDAFVELGPPLPKQPKRNRPQGTAPEEPGAPEEPPADAGGAAAEPGAQEPATPRRRRRRLAATARSGEHVFVPAAATILHADLDAFYASVEQRDDPRLRGRPVIVGAGVVLAASYEARASGVRSAMGGRRARRLCPEALVVPPRWSAYVEASKAVFGVFERTSPLVEGLSIDEAFLDARGLERIQGSPEEIAVALRREVRDRVGLPITVGVATTKFLAKVASAVAKPDGLLVVPAGGERAFLEPLPVEALWGVGPATAARLRARGLARVGDVARLGEEGLVAILGVAAGRHLHHLAHNRDPRPVRAGRRRRSVGSQCALNFASRPPGEIDRTLVALVDRVTRRMRRSRARRPHRRPAPALRRLLAGVPLADPPGRDRRHPGGPRDRPRAAGGGAPDDRAAGPHPPGRGGLQPRRRPHPAPAAPARPA